MESQFYQFPHRVDDTVAVWEEFKEITQKYKCISLGEGAPAASPPQFLIDELFKAIQEGHNQYTRTFGNPLLVNKIADFYGNKLTRVINPLTEVLILIFYRGQFVLILMGLINPGKGEEVALFEPCWPCYIDHIQYAGAVYKSIPLSIQDGVWRFDVELFRKSLNLNTKVLIINNAQNPTGKIFTKEELQQISKVLEDFPHIIVLSDDVYEFLTFDGNEFVNFASLDNNFSKTLTVYSGGKLFNATGWKVGWAVGPDYLIKPCAVISNTVIYCANTPVQVAISRSLDQTVQKGYLGHPDISYVEYIRKEFQDVRDLLNIQTFQQSIFKNIQKYIKINKLGIIQYYFQLKHLITNFESKIISKLQNQYQFFLF